MKTSKLRWVIIAPPPEVEKRVAIFSLHAPGLVLEVGPAVAAPETVDVLLLWNHPKGSLAPFTQAKLYYSLGAGVDHLMADPSRRGGVPICRIVDPKLSFSMSNYIIFAVLHYHRQWDKYQRDQHQKHWDHDAPAERAIRIGILGLGTLGTDAAIKLNQLGFPVVGYSPSPKQVENIPTFSEGALASFLSACNVLVCTVPYTPKTHGLLSKRLFDQLNPSSFLINVSRGKVQDEKDLLSALDNGKLSGAFLDVFETEPLPPDSPLWEHPRVYITPHVASITQPEAGVHQIIENSQLLHHHRPLKHRVDEEKGY